MYVCYTGNMNGTYFYTAVIGFVLGVGAASVWVVGFAYIVWVVALTGVVALIASRKSEAISAGHLQLLSLFLIVLALGMVRFNIESLDEDNQQYESQIDTQVTLEGIVAREPDVREDTTHVYVSVEDELFLVKTNRYTKVQYGDAVTVMGTLRKPEVFITELGRTFNYPKYLHARGVSYALSFSQIEVRGHEQGNRVVQTLLKGKQKFMQRIESVIPEPEVGLAEGLLLGVKQALGDELETVFRKTGIIHIVVLSGYNVTLVVIFITYILSYLLPYRMRTPFGLLAIVCFAILVGLSATVVRASIMAALILFARATGQTYAVMRALMFAGVVMIIINPYLLVYDVGFQLSFVATLGLLLVAPYIDRLLHFIPNFLQIREFLTATLATQIFVMPILLYSIGEFSLVSVLVNVLVLPMVPVAMLLTFITGLVGFIFPAVAVLLGYITYLCLLYILSVATFFATVPLASVTVTAFPFVFVVLGYFVMGYGLYWLHIKNNPLEIQKNVDVLKDTDIDREDGLDGWVIEQEEVAREKCR